VHLANDHWLAPPNFNITPEKWWLEGYFPFGMVYFQGRAVTLSRDIPKSKEDFEIPLKQMDTTSWVATPTHPGPSPRALPSQVLRDFPVSLQDQRWGSLMVTSPATESLDGKGLVSWWVVAIIEFHISDKIYHIHMIYGINAIYSVNWVDFCCWKIDRDDVQLRPWQGQMWGSDQLSLVKVAVDEKLPSYMGIIMSHYI